MPSANDNFADAEDLGSDVTGVVFPNVSSDTTEVSEPEVDADFGSTVWYQWTAPADGTWYWNAQANDSGLGIFVYTGAVLATLVEQEGAKAADGLVRLELTAVEGTVYKIQVGAYMPDDGLGDIVVDWSQNPPPANDLIADAEPLVGTPDPSFGGVSGTIVGTTKGATYGPIYDPVGNVEFGDSGFSVVWYKFQLPLDETRLTFTVLSGDGTFVLDVLDLSTVPPASNADADSLGSTYMFAGGTPFSVTVDLPADSYVYIGFASRDPGPDSQSDFTIAWEAVDARAGPSGISFAFDDVPMEPDPAWTRVDVPASQPWRTVDWEINGPNRDKETEHPNSGNATLTIIDRDGTFDLTNPFSDLAGKLKPGIQAAICLQDSAGLWHWRFRGIVDEINVDIDVDGQRARVRIELIDAFAYLSQIELRTGVFGDPLKFGEDGDVAFDETADDDPLQASSRMHKVLDTIGWPVSLRRLFTSNVRLQRSIYSRDEHAMDVLVEAGDAEFPGVGVLFTSKHGIITYHGRRARFAPEDYQSDDDISRTGGNSICFWSVGSMNVLDDDPNIVVIGGPLSYRMSRKDVLNDVLILPQNVEETDVPGNRVVDSGSRISYGTMSLTVDNLRILEGPLDSTAVEQTQFMGAYFVDNMSQPRVRITQMRFVSRSAGMAGAAALRDFLAGVDISDVVTVTTRHFDRTNGYEGPFGFAADYFVEGISMSATPDTSDGTPRVTATLDVSPRAFYDTDPFE